ncbi:MAG: hypothetical protein PHZ19_03070 [Candidatus Thermoplasmatota archaeon]|nr:hypothetical protein [Candidatus Thermoplasmatota archaeon]
MDRETWTKWWGGEITWSHRIVFLLVAVFAPLFFLRLPLHVDESVYLYVGREMGSAALYRDLLVNKPAGIFLLSALVHRVGGFVAARVLIYGLNLLSAVLVYRTGAGLRSPRAGWAAALVFLCGMYIFQGYYFLTEPVVACLIALSLYGLFAGRHLWSGVAAGSTLLFNYSAALFIVAVLFYLALQSLYARRRHGLWFALGLAVPGVALLLPLFHYGLVDAYLYCTVTLLMQWSHPPEPLLLAEAVVLFFPVWMAFLYSLRRLPREVAGKDTAALFLKAYILLGVAYMASTYAGKHMMLFLPPLALTAATAVTGKWRGRLVVVMLAVLVTVSSLHLALGGDVGEQRAEVREMDPHIQGAMYTLPFRLHVPYFSSHTTWGVRWATQVYSGELAEMVIRDLEDNQVRYVVVEKSWEQTYEQGGHFFEGRETVYLYVREHYVPAQSTHAYTVYQREKPSS